VPTISKIIKGTGEKAIIRNIIISGNKKTLEKVVVRELGFSVGDSLPVNNIAGVLDRLKLNLLNTKLFSDVQMNIKNWENEGLDLDITVVEKWYIIPIPIFQLADRNINEWWVDRNHDFSRIQYGLTVNWSNFRGRNENLIVSASLGFAQMFNITYEMPNLSKNGKIGTSFNIMMLQSKRMPYNTFNDKLIFYYDDEIIKRSMDMSSRLLLHRNIYIQHYIETKISYRWIADKISELNNDYFLNGANTQLGVSLEYGFDIDRRTLKAYPTRGYRLQGTITNYGLGLQKQVNVTTASLYLSKFFTLDDYDKHSTGHSIKLKGSYPSKQPYNIQSGLGYEQDFVRGYELFVIDGQSYALIKNEYRYRLGSLRLAFNKKKTSNYSKQVFPIDFYLKTYLDAGYVEDKYFTKSNTLRNQWMIGTGVGLDVLILYDKLIRMEYSINREKQHGFFIHLELPFK
jgi:outer membrane protein assembly factor BamA